MSAVIDTAPVRGRAPAHKSNESGGDMDDVLKRLCALESLASATRADVSAIKAVLPHLATKEDIGLIKAESNGVRAEINAVNSGLKTDIGDLRAAIAEAETRMTRWMVGALFLATSAAVGLAKVLS
jgi:hypothetical protein